MHRLFRLSIPATLVILAVVMTPRIEAQATRADSAAILLEATRRLELEGESVAAQELMDLIVRHFPGTPAAAEAELTLTASRSQNLERSGRASLIAFSTLYGGWLGVAVPAAFGANEPEPFGAGLLIGAPLGFFASKAIVDRYPMGSGQAALTGPEPSTDAAPTPEGGAVAFDNAADDELGGLDRHAGWNPRKIRQHRTAHRLT